MVNITCRVLSRPDETKLAKIYRCRATIKLAICFTKCILFLFVRNLGKDHDEKVLPSIINEVLKSVVVTIEKCSVLM
jgi:prohibitin 2